MRNTPLPFMSPFNQGIGTNKEELENKLKEGFKQTETGKQLDIDNQREELSKNFESARTKKEKRKQTFVDSKKDIKKEINKTQRSLYNVRTSEFDKDGQKEAAFRDRKKALRMKLQKARLDERKERAEDRKQQWAEKQFMKGKFDSVDDAKKRFEVFRGNSEESKKLTNDIIQTFNQPGPQASEDTEKDVYEPTQEANLAQVGNMQQKVIGTRVDKT